MIKNVSYRDENIEQEIQDLVGKPYPWIDRIKMNGNGSPRLTVLNASEKLLNLLERDNYINYCHVEIRPAGIIVGIRSRLDSYSWCIPFYKLFVSQNMQGYRIYSDTEHIVVQSGKSNVGAFFRKLINYKKQYLEKEKEYLDNFPAPFVKESRLKIGLNYLEEYRIAANNTIFVVGEIQTVYLPQEIVKKNGEVDLNGIDDVCISGLNSYHEVSRFAEFSYARPCIKPKNTFQK